MKTSSFTYVINWKTYFSFLQTYQWLVDNAQSLNALAKNHSLIICPSMDALASAAFALQESGIALGAQNCSVHEPGPFTGQVLAISLKEIGCAFVLLGHAEVRAAFSEGDTLIATKMRRAIEHDVTPILCIGEDAQAYEENRGTTTIEEQLIEPLRALRYVETSKKILIAYEPIWTINSNAAIDTDYMARQIQTIKAACSAANTAHQFEFLYGGSVTFGNISAIKQIPDLSGVLIGHASTDFQTLEKIVLS